MRIRERYELADQLRSRYLGAGRVERGQLLDSFCLATAYERKCAIKVLKWRRRRPRRQRVPGAKGCGSGFRSALKICCEASDYLCSQRLQPFLPDLARILGRHGQLTCSPETIELLASASVGTVERNLHELRRVLVGRRMSQSKPGGLLRREIPLVVGRWRDMDTPGYLEIELVSHGGEVAAGEWIWTLCATDLSGLVLSERMAVMGKGQPGSWRPWKASSARCPSRCWGFPWGLARPIWRLHWVSPLLRPAAARTSPRLPTTL